MKKNTKKRKINIPTPLFFIASIVIILYFFPRENKFIYTYSEKKPWLYGLLTAPFDFHIQKSDNQVEMEKDSIMRLFQPYYMYDTTAIENKMESLFLQDASARSVSPEYIKYIEGKLNEIYKAGIISAEDYESVEKTDKKQLRLFNNENIAITRHISSFYTPKQAYEEILSDHPSSLSLSELKVLNLNNYLMPNIVYDGKSSSNVKDELLQQVVLYEGMVQAGEKIIDRGEIVDSHTFDILNSYIKEMESRGGIKNNPAWLAVGQMIMITLLVMSVMVYLLFYRPREYFNRKNVIFILLAITAFSLITSICVKLKLESLLYIIPFTMSPILIRTFIDSRTAIIVHSITILICALMISNPAEFMMIQLLVGYVCIYSLKNLAERSQLIYCALFILLAYIVSYSGWVLCFGGDISQLNWKMYIYFCINFIFITFSYLLVYVCEKTFGFISEVSMVELSNINKPLLLRLSETAPGTFQHSMQVSNLVAAAATRIGANAALARTGALYHDIGKMENPAYFTENQTPGMNPHAGLSYVESAQIIIGHVTEGVKIAKKNNLPQQIIDFIETHHGKGKVKYFYYSYKNEYPDEEVNEADFTYPGPNPFSKETALLMMADTVEAASRSLKVYNQETISALVNKLIDEQLKEGLFQNAPITFKDIEKAKEVFIDKLLRIYHSRIAYPELKENVEKEINEKPMII